MNYTKLTYKALLSEVVAGCAMIGSLLMLSSCGDFLKEYSTDQRYCETPQDLEDLMIGEAFLPTGNINTYAPGSMLLGDLKTYNFPYIHVLDDDAQMLVSGNVKQGDNLITPLHILGAMYEWAEDPRVDALNKKWVDDDWGKTYKSIGAINAIIYQAVQMEKGVKGKELELLHHDMGEAHFLRAYYYFYLTNLYGMPYARATADKDFSVPLKVSETIEDRYFSRNTNAEVWGQIVSDLETAAKLLQGYTPATKLRVGYYAVKALQCRVALYMEDYDKVIQCAAEFDHSPYTLIDLNQKATTDNILCRSASDVIFTMSQNEIPSMFANDGSVWNSTTSQLEEATSCFCVSPGLLGLYDAKDLRLTHYFRQTATTHASMPDKYKSWATMSDPEMVSATYALRSTEVLLNASEAYAMQGKADEARSLLHQLRSRRFAGTDDSQVPADAAALVQFIRDERRRELCFEGHRWFDLRRYAVNSKYPLPPTFTVTHPVYAYDEGRSQVVREGSYVLESFQKDPAAWLIPVPDETINFNRGQITNLVRGKRTLHQ